MTTQTVTPTAPDLLPESDVPQEPGHDARLYGYGEDYARRLALRLRETSFEEGERHPDRRPCPPWCVGARYSTYEHEIEVDNPFEALHRINGGISSVASRYPGVARGESVQAATLYSVLEQRGQRDPVLQVGVRTYDAQGKQDADLLFNPLRLSLEDARELVKVLSYLVDLADHAEGA